MNYYFIREFLFKLEAERAHTFALTLLEYLARLKIGSFIFPSLPESPVEIMGLKFANRLGCAAGLDKNADYLNGLGQLGFGHIEVGCVTPRPQPGNAKPRLFRLLQDEALINRMGFNNLGVDYAVQRLKVRKYKGIVGINVGKNKETPLENAADDYNFCLERVYPCVDFITINISSPNTPGLRELQTQEYLEGLLVAVKEKQQRLAEQHKKYVPLLVKLSPDLNDDQIENIAATIAQQNIDGVIATNTALFRPLLLSASKGEQGGLSGKPLTQRSTEIIRKLYHCLPSTIPIIAVGGIMSAEDAMTKRQAGAQLVQVYTGLIYHGPQLLSDIAKAEAETLTISSEAR